MNNFFRQQQLELSLELERERERGVGSPWSPLLSTTTTTTATALNSQSISHNYYHHHLDLTLSTCVQPVFPTLPLPCTPSVPRSRSLYFNRQTQVFLCIYLVSVLPNELTWTKWSHYTLSLEDSSIMSHRLHYKYWKRYEKRLLAWKELSHSRHS